MMIIIIQRKMQLKSSPK